MKKILKRIKALLPSKLPQGVTEFNLWADEIIEIYDMPNNDSIRFALATALMHLGPTDAYKPKEYFGRILIKGAAGQVAYGMMQELKKKQAEEQEAAAKKLKEEQDALSTKSQEDDGQISS
jgi:hypothetical protein